jgi:hypothetical protein
MIFIGAVKLDATATLTSPAIEDTEKLSARNKKNIF